MAGRAVARRKHAAGLKWIRAALYTALALIALRTADFYPGAIDALAAVSIGALGIFAPGLSVLALVVALSIPMMAADLVTGAMFLVIGFAAVQYLGQDDAGAFTVIAAAFLGLKAGFVWAVAPLAGYMLGSAEGAVAALVACLAVEAAGVLLGVDAMGAVASGGAPERVVLAFGAVDDPLKFAWFMENVKSVEPNTMLTAFSRVSNVGALIAQPVIWAVSAAIAGAARRPTAHPKRTLFALAGTVGATMVAVAGSVLAVQTAGGDGPTAGAMGAAALISFVAAPIIVLVLDRAFPPLVIEAPARAPRPSSMSSEDADVDELLRLIASAEEELASKHTTSGIVMITDMKSFSKMTEEEGSVVSAKLIQKHRDLLLPLMEKYGGRGKSTGGDGLVAKFPTARDAVDAAVEMQRALAQHNASKSSEREMTIRIGIATGEIVLDKGGRPFIGAALNQAARVMNLADGGQVMTVKEVIDAAGRDACPTFSHGRFALKNIAEPVEVFEVLWGEDQVPQPPPVAPVE